MKKKIRLFIIDDQELFCESIIHSLEDFGVFIIKGHSGSGVDSIKKLRKCHPYVDIVLIEYKLPDIMGTELAGTLKKISRELKLVLLSGETGPALVDQVTRCGMHGLLSKKKSLNIFFRSIMDIHAGEFVIHYDSEKKPQARIHATDLNTRNFTRRELEIIQNIAKGKKTREIAQSLFISYKTVENHRANILQKSGASNMIELINFLIKKNYI